MKIKMDTEFVSFSDGICNIYKVNDEGEKIYKYRNLGYSNRILGYKRFWAAAANQMEINKVIRIPQVSGIDTYDSVEIEGVGEYDVKMVQSIFDTNPQSIDLTLRHV